MEVCWEEWFTIPLQMLMWALDRTCLLPCRLLKGTVFNVERGWLGRRRFVLHAARNSLYSHLPLEWPESPTVQALRTERPQLLPTLRKSSE